MSRPRARVGSLTDFLRKPAKWFWTSAPIILALAFVSGAFIAVDSSQMAVVRSRVESVPADFVGHGVTSDPLTNELYLDQRCDYVGSIEGVEEVESLVVLKYVFVVNEDGLSAPYYTGGHFPVMFMNPESERTLRSYGIEGEVPGPGTIAVPKQMADDLAVTVGDPITLHFTESVYEYDPAIGDYRWRSEELYVPFNLTQIWTQDGFKDQVVYMPDGSSQQYLDVDPRAVLIREFLNPAVLNTDDLYQIVESLGNDLLGTKYFEESESLYLMWIDTDRYLDYADTDRSVERLDALYGRMSSQVLSYGVSVQRSDLVWAIGPWDVEDLYDYRLRYLGLSLPVLVIGAYVAAVGAGISSDLSEDSIRALSAQGVRRRTIVGRMTSYSSIVGLIAGVIGLLAGVLVSRVVLERIAVDVSGDLSLSVSVSDFGITWFTILATLGLGLLFIVLASFLASLRTTKAVWTGDYGPSVLSGLLLREIAMLVLASISIVAIAAGQRWEWSHGFDWYFSSVDAFFSHIGLVLFPLLPFVLALGLVGLLTKRPLVVQRRLMKYLSNGSESVNVPVGPMAGRLDKRVRRICAMISLVLALGIFLTAVSETIVLGEEETIRFDLGSDISVYASYHGGWNGTEWVEDPSYPELFDVTPLPGVSHAALFQYFLPTVTGVRLAQAVVIDPLNYLDTVDPSSGFTNGDPEEIIGSLTAGDKLLITELYASDSGLGPGDTVTVAVTIFDSWSLAPDPPVTYNLTLQVAHIVEALPGISYADLIFGSSSLASIPKEGFDTSSNGGGVIIDAAPEADQAGIASEAVRVFMEGGYEASSMTLDDELADLEASPDYGGLTQFLAVEFVFVMAVVLVGVVAASHATSRFVMSFSARGGATPAFLSSVRKALASESVALAVVGASVGIAVGILTAFLFGIMWVPQGTESIGTRMTVAVLAVAVVSFVLTAALAFVSSLRGSDRKATEAYGGP